MTTKAAQPSPQLTNADITFLKDACRNFIAYYDDPTYADQMDEQAQRASDGNVSALDALISRLNFALIPFQPDEARWANIGREADLLLTEYVNFAAELRKDDEAFYRTPVFLLNFAARAQKALQGDA